MVYTVAKDKVRDAEVEVFSDPSGWKVFRNEDAFPRAWATGDAAVISNESGAPLPRPEPCGGEATADFQEQSLHRVRVRAQMPCAAFLIFGDAYFPGWQLLLDGQASTLYRAHDALRAAFVAAGEHSVEFVYRPASVYVGGVLSGLGLLGWAVLGVVAFRRKRGRSSGS